MNDNRSLDLMDVKKRKIKIPYVVDEKPSISQPNVLIVCRTTLEYSEYTVM
jgi:hypothetical protein